MPDFFLSTFYLNYFSWPVTRYESHSNYMSGSVNTLVNMYFSFNFDCFAHFYVGFCSVKIKFWYWQTDYSQIMLVI